MTTSRWLAKCRRILLCPAAVWFLILITTLPAMAQLSSTSLSHKLTLIQPSDPEFDRLLAANFPGFDRLDGYATFRPFLAVLRNDTEHTVRTYMMLWDRRAVGEAQPRPINSFVYKYDPSPAVSRAALAPGEIRLVAPNFDLSPQEYRTVIGHNLAAGKMADFQGRPPYSLPDTQAVIPSVDAVFDDGACVGENRHQTFERFQHELDSERELAEELLQLMDGKKSEAEVEAFLKNEVQTASTVGASESNLHNFFRFRHLQRFLTEYRRGGMESVMTRAWTISRHPQMKLQRLASE